MQTDRGHHGAAWSGVTPVPVLLTDFYQLTMAQAYFALGMRGTAVFELFVRRLPPGRRFLVAAGLERALDYLAQLRFTGPELEFLGADGGFDQAFLEHLAALRFTGEVHALPEGTPFFADEPILRVTAPIVEAQLVESRLMNILHFDTLIASKAARVVLAAQGRSLLDFGLRRAHGAEAGLCAARSAFLAGFDATATVEAGRRFGIPLSGTMAHSFVQAAPSEREALASFVRARAAPTTLLIDTYDTVRGAHEVVRLLAALRAEGLAERVQAVRLDSGDLDALSREVRRILDAGGGGTVRIVASGNLDEYRVRALVGAAAPIDAFGVGTSLDVSADAPALDMAYKLQEYDGIARRKRSTGKATWPGRKQVWRARDGSGNSVGDLLGLETEAGVGEPLLHAVMRDGVRLGPPPPLREARAHCLREVARLPAALREVDPAARAEAAGDYPVVVSAGVRQLAVEVDRRTA